MYAARDVQEEKMVAVKVLLLDNAKNIDDVLVRVMTCCCGYALSTTTTSNNRGDLSLWFDHLSLSLSLSLIHIHIHDRTILSHHSPTQ